VLLLEEIRDLEPPPAIYSRPEDIQDFEIGVYNIGVNLYEYFIKKLYIYIILFIYKILELKLITSL